MVMDFDVLFNDGFENRIERKNESDMAVESCRKVIVEKFGDIVFLEEGHKYTIDGNEYTPVSNVIQMYEPVVDWDKKAGDYARKYGRKKEDVQKEWKLNNLRSTISGTRTHEFGESYTNMMCGHPERICEQNKPQYIPEYDTLVPTYPKEESIKKFYDELEPNLHPVGAEFKLSSKYMPDVNPICGTCDLLFYDSNTDTYVIGDWKTNKSLIKEYSRSHRIMMNGCVSGLVDEPLSHYTIQFNIYQTMLESVGLKISRRILIWLKEDGTYERFEISRLSEDTVKHIMKGECR